MKTFRVTPRAALPRGFTLIELLTVIAIIGILAAIIIPVVGKVRQSAYSAKSTSNLRQLQFANIAYATDNKGNFVRPYNAPTGFGEEPWVTSAELARYSGMLKADWGQRLPTSVSGFPLTIPNTIGYNHTDYNVLWRSKALNQSEILNASRHIAFSESADWIVSYGGRNNWLPADDTNYNNAIAYRAGGKSIVVSYGGNVQRISSEDANQKDRWIIQSGVGGLN